jgi:hypothetical protein
MGMEAWYRGIILVWLALGLPSILLGIGFAGGNPFHDLNFKQFSGLGLVLWFSFATLLLAPLWLAPFGIKKRKHADVKGNDTERSENSDSR